MTDLPDRILAAIEQTAHIAEKARDAGSVGVYGHTIQEKWLASDDGHIYTMPDGVTIVTGPYGLDTEVANHVLRHQPSVVLRRCEADKRTVERHAPHGTFYNDCGGCGEDWPCPDLLDRADAYGIEAS